MTTDDHDAAGLAGLLDTLSPQELTDLAGQVSSPGELRKLLDLSNGDDSLILAFLARAGADALLDRVFALMGTRFLAERLGDDPGVVQWNIDTPEGQKIYHLTIADGKADGARGAAARPRTTLTMGAPDLLRLCAGRLEGITAFMNGKIKLAGDMMFGAKLPAIFDTSSDGDA